MVIVVLEKCPLSLRGDLTKWLQEVSLGVYVGRINARVRERLWLRICEQAKTGRVTMVYSANNEQRFACVVHNSAWKPADFDGLKLILKPASESIKKDAPKQHSYSSAYGFSRKRFHGSVKEGREPEEYSVIDIETTGLDYSKDKIIELGALKIIGGSVVDSFQTLVSDVGDIPLSAVELTGINQEIVAKEGVSLKKALRRFLRFIGQAPIVSHNIAFDYNFIQAACDVCDEIMFDNECIDTLAMARKKLKSLSDYRLGSLAQHLDIDINTFHRSTPDCFATYKLFTKLIKM